MKGTRWRPLLREFAARLHRELRIAWAPVPRPEKWVFVVGCYNSGTELLLHLLGSHPSIGALPMEGQFLTDELVSDYELGLPRAWALREELFRLTEADAGPDPVRLKKEWAIRLDRSRPVLLEKSPPNAARTRWLQAHFENAHFLAIVRNGYAVAEGIRRKAKPKHRRDGWSVEQAARQWVRSYEILLEDADYLERTLWVRYEDLAERPGEETARILRFLDLEPRALELERPWAVHEREEPIRNMNAESLARLAPDEVRVVSRVAGPMLERFGYEVL